jgi:hypothetical protein
MEQGSLPKILILQPLTCVNNRSFTPLQPQEREARRPSFPAALTRSEPEQTRHRFYIVDIPEPVRVETPRLCAPFGAQNGRLVHNRCS